jgi:hypothetical protein
VGGLQTARLTRDISKHPVSIRTIAFPVMTAVTLGTDLPSLWASRAFSICGADRLRRQLSNRAVLFRQFEGSRSRYCAARRDRRSSIHAILRNNHPFEEGRNFYRAAALELTRRWHEESDGPLSAVSGDDALAFATAFYSEGHPVYARPFAYQYTWGSLRRTTLEKGWAALCFVDGKDRDTGSAIHTVRVRRSVELAGHAWCQKTRCCAHRSAPPGRRSPAVAGLQRRRRFRRQSPATFEPELSDPFYRPEGVRTPCHASRTCW